MADTLVIPTVDTPMSRDAVLGGQPPQQPAPRQAAPAAPQRLPVNGSQPVIAPPPAATPDQSSASDFLAGVKAANEKRVGNDPKPVDPPADDADDVEDEPEPIAATDDAPPADDVEFADPTDQPKPNKKSNIRNLKLSLRSERTRATVAEQKAQELETQLQNYADVQERLERLAELEDRVQQLEPYEKMFDIYQNPEFQEKYVTGISSELTAAQQIATDYKVADAEAVIEQALSIENRKDRNDFLRQHGLDDLGIQEISPHIIKAQQLAVERDEVAKNPDEARSQLSMLAQQNQAARIEKAVQKVKHRSQEAWGQIAGMYSKGENAVDQLKERPGDPEHTQKRQHIIEKSSEEYGKVTGALARLGITDLPAGVAQTLSAHFLLGQTAAVIIQDNKKLQAEVADLRKQLKDTTSYTRPQLTPSGRGLPNGEAPKDTRDMAAAVFNGARQKVLDRDARK